MAANKREPIFKLAYQCSKPQCGAYRWRAVADTRGETRCIKCFAPFAQECIFKEVPQRKPAPGGGPRSRGAGRGPAERPPASKGNTKGGGGNPAGGKTTSQRGGKGGGTAERSPHPTQNLAPPKPLGLQPERLPQPAQHLPRGRVEELQKQYDDMLAYFKGNSHHGIVVQARQELEAELRRLEDLKTPQERAQDLDHKLCQARNAVGSQALALARAQQAAQEAQDRVDQLDGELQASLEEIRNLEIQKDKLVSQLPSDRAQISQKESPEERELTNAIALLMHRLGDEPSAQQTVNLLQDQLIRAESERKNTTAVEDDRLEHGLPPTPPWPLEAGSTVRETVVAHASLSTQRHLVQFLQSKGKGKREQGHQGQLRRRQGQGTLEFSQNLRRGSLTTS